MITPEDLTPLDRALLRRLRNLYADSVAEDRKTERRRRNKATRAARRTNRKARR